MTRSATQRNARHYAEDVIAYAHRIVASTKTGSCTFGQIEERAHLAPDHDRLSTYSGRLEHDACRLILRTMLTGGIGNATIADLDWI